MVKSKWYHRIYFHLIDMVIVNAWILWRNYKNADIHLANFKLTIMDAGKHPLAVTWCGRLSHETNNIRKLSSKVNKAHSTICFKSVDPWQFIRCAHFFMRKPFFCLCLNFLNIMLEIWLKFS